MKAVREPDGVHPLLLDGTEATGDPGAGGDLHLRIRRTVLDRILDGVWPAGRRVGVSALADETGISRTPVREALLQLEREGFLRLEENRGFFVPPLTEREARELYPILHALEDLALVGGGRPPREHLERLEEINRELAGTDDPARAISLNFAWHRALTARTPNGELRRLLHRYRIRIHRYEHAYYEPGTARVAYSVELHWRIQRALAAGDMGTARAVLEEHWVGDYSLYLPRGSPGDRPDGPAASGSGEGRNSATV